MTNSEHPYFLRAVLSVAKFYGISVSDTVKYYQDEIKARISLYEIGVTDNDNDK